LERTSNVGESLKVKNAPSCRWRRDSRTGEQGDAQAYDFALDAMNEPGLI